MVKKKAIKITLIVETSKKKKIVVMVLSGKVHFKGFRAARWYLR